MRAAAAFVFDIALLLAPPAFRREYRVPLRRDFARCFDDERALHGPVGAAAYALEATTDLLATVLREYAAMLFRDFAYAFRALRKTPSFAAVVIATLALAIGANAAVFSILNAVALAPLPYANPERLLSIDLWFQGKLVAFSLPDFADTMRGIGDAKASAAAYRAETVTVTGLGRPRSISATVATPEFFTLLGTKPEVGRFFTSDDATAGEARVVVISDALWRDAYGQSPAAIGSMLRLDGVAYRVIGVAPASFRQPGGRGGFSVSNVWTAVPDDGRGTANARDARRFEGIVRLRDGATASAVGVAASETIARLARIYPTTDIGQSIVVESLADRLIGNVRGILFAMFVAVGAVLLVACANVANLLLSRAASRDREFSVRIAIGASRGRIVAQLLVETFVLALAGGAIGIALAYGIVDAFVALHPTSVPRADSVSVDAASVLYTFGVVVFCTIVAGIAPAFASSQRNVATALKSAGRGGDATSGARARQFLVTGEIAATLALVVVAGLVLRSFITLTSQPLGFDPANTSVVGPYELPDRQYTDIARERYMSNALERVRAVPGVESAAFTFPVPFSHGIFSTSVIVRGETVRRGDEPTVDVQLVSDGFFTTMKARMRAGRSFVTSDVAKSLPVVIVNEAYAKRFLAGRTPVGTMIDVGYTDNPAEPPTPFRTIVGVVANVRASYTQPNDPLVYVPESQHPQNGSSLVIRAIPGSHPLPEAIARIAALDPQIPTPAVKSFDTMLAENVGVQHLSVAALSALAFIALALSIAGVFAVVSYGVTQRTHEFGVRMALGAETRHIIRMVLGGAMRLAAAGVGVGLVVAAVGTHFLANQLYDTQPLDPLTFGLVTAIVVTAAVLAAFFPAHRATRVDPIVALRYE